jgi:sugar lactone lactonase YvrE
MQCRLSFLLAAVFLAFSVTPLPVAARALGDSQVIALVPDAGFPEGIATRGHRFYVSSPAFLGQPFNAAFVYAYDSRTGGLDTTYRITITNPSVGRSAAWCLAFGPDGKLYVIEPFVGVIRMDLDPRNTQSVYAAFPPTGPSSLLNDLAFDDAGNLYVTDTFAATIYKIPAGGGTPTVWFTDPALAGAPPRPIGVNGIRIDKHNQYVYVSVTNSPIGGAIYRLPLVAQPVATDLQLFAWLGNNEMNTGPDGLAFGKSGKLYVAEALTSTIRVFNPDGSVDAVYGGPAQHPPGASVPWANPANIAFNDKAGTLLVTNHGILVPNAVFMVFDVFVNDKGSPLP